MLKTADEGSVKIWLGEFVFGHVTWQGTWTGKYREKAFPFKRKSLFSFGCLWG